MSHKLLLQHQGKRVWLIDASIYVFRAWFVRTPPRYDPNHQPINAVLGFLHFLYALLQEQHPTHIAFAFDTHLHTSQRKTLYPAYKANRVPTPDALKYQFQCCRDFLDALGIVQHASHHYEADDLIGTWAAQQRHSTQPPAQMVIISGDKDLTQLVHKNDIWWDYGRRKPLHDGGIKSEFGVWPQQIADQLALAGDKADNIPGIPGVGMATAAKLLKFFGNLDNLLKNPQHIQKYSLYRAKHLQTLVETHQDNIRLARQLTGIYCEVEGLPSNLKRGAKDSARLQALCQQWGLSEQQYQQWLAI